MIQYLKMKYFNHYFYSNVDVNKCCCCCGAVLRVVFFSAGPEAGNESPSRFLAPLTSVSCSWSGCRRHRELCSDRRSLIAVLDESDSDI